MSNDTDKCEKITDMLNGMSIEELKKILLDVKLQIGDKRVFENFKQIKYWQIAWNRRHLKLIIDKMVHYEEGE